MSACIVYRRRRRPWYKASARALDCHHLTYPPTIASSLSPLVAQQPPPPSLTVAAAAAISLAAGRRTSTQSLPAVHLAALRCIVYAPLLHRTVDVQEQTGRK